MFVIPNEGHHGWIAEHNLVAEWFYGTQIKENEEVHHIDFVVKIIYLKILKLCQ